MRYFCWKMFMVVLYLVKNIHGIFNKDNALIFCFLSGSSFFLTMKITRKKFQLQASFFYNSFLFLFLFCYDVVESECLTMKLSNESEAIQL